MKRMTGTLIALAGLAGCSSNNTNNDAGVTDTGVVATGDSGGGNDAGTGSEAGTSGNDGGSTASGACVGGMAVNNPNCVGYDYSCPMSFCPAQVTNNPATPSFVITSLDPKAPAALANVALAGILNNAIAGGHFFWGASFNFTTNMLRTGNVKTSDMATAGHGYLTASFSFINGTAPAVTGGSQDVHRWDPASLTLTAGASETASTNAGSGIITIPIYNMDNVTLLTELPIHNPQLSAVQFYNNRNCIGLATPMFSTCSSQSWYASRDPADSDSVTGGTIEGDISFDDAKNVRIELLNESLCKLLAGAECTTMEATYPNPPSTTMGVFGWHLRSNFSAVAANIAQ